MSQDRPSSKKRIKEIEIALSSKASVASKNGSLKFQLRQEAFQSVERLLWRAILNDAITKGQSNTLSVATCQSYERTLFL